ncbi:MAG: thioredoxin family protein [Polyangiales bacterium]
MRSLFVFAAFSFVSACDAGGMPARPRVEPAASAPARVSDEPWNPTQIAWRSYDEGLAEAKTSHKPICLVFYTTWCPHCGNFSRVFDDPRVAAASKSFVMIRLDKDANEPLSAQFAVDGEYIPRTYFLNADGKLAADIHATHPRYKYFYDEKDPTALLTSMKTATAQLGGS